MSLYFCNYYQQTILVKGLLINNQFTIVLLGLLSSSYNSHAYCILGTYLCYICPQHHGYQMLQDCLHFPLQSPQILHSRRNAQWKDYRQLHYKYLDLSELCY